VALRYQRQKLYSERSGVKTYEGLDPLTGLPVLLYEFAGKPDPALGDLESENIPGILETAQDNGQGQVVVAYSKGYSPARKPLELASSDFVLEGAKSLADAARAGVIHGDIRPERFLVSGDHVLIEGFGIPWVSGPSSYAPPEGVANYAGDIYAFGRVMQELAPDLPVPVKTLLERCVARKPEDRPSAAQLLTALVALQNSPQETEKVKPAPAAQSKPSAQQTLEIDFTVSEPEAPQPVVMPPITPNTTARVTARTDVDMFGDGSSTASDLKDFESDFDASDFDADDFDIPAPPRTLPPQTLSSQSLSSQGPSRTLPQDDDWQDDEHDMLLETDPGGPRTPTTPVTNTPSAKSALPSKTSSKLPDSGPVRPDPKRPDPKQTFIKDLPPGATYKAGKPSDLNDAKPAPFKETPNPTFDEVFLKGTSPSKNTRRIVMVVALLLGALVLAGLAFFGGNGITGQPAQNTTTANYIVSVNLDPPNLPPLDLIVVASPEGSRFRAGAVVSKVPGQIVLDKAGTWQFQGRFQDTLSGAVTLRTPEQHTLTITMPNLLPPVEGEEETPTEGEAVEPVAPDDANP
jgi:serine/threonine protein kinase